MPLRVSTSARRKNAPRPAEKSAPQFLQWVRGRECVFVVNGGCDGKTQAMHLDFAGDKGMATKVSDRFVVPCCSTHHRLQHERGWHTFMRMMGVTTGDLMDAAAFLWGKWPGRIAWEKKLDG